MGTPKRSPIERASVKGIGDLRRRRDTLLSPKAQVEMQKRVSHRARKLK